MRCALSLCVSTDARYVPQSFVVTKIRAPGFKVDGKHVFIAGASISPSVS